MRVKTFKLFDIMLDICWDNNGWCIDTAKGQTAAQYFSVIKLYSNDSVCLYCFVFWNLLIRFQKLK